ncbi:proton-conducting transporter transmembrane domain-containing protein [Halorarius halobius]|uniref:proton-conducting transporter transmembrane domain-containing protein n=1 Tax=Halorarius halobius TaxID=2962671 RepID=UPI0020CF9B7A|nr:proton-conducting transporter membrane subunit [Halorarius halobius]
MPASLAFLAAALVAALAPRRVGTAAGVLAGAATAAWAVTTPGGTLAVSLWGFDLAPVAVDGLTRPVAFVFGLVAAANALFAHGSGADRRELATQFAYVGASLGAVLSGDWLTLVVHWELMAAAATVLVWRTAADRAPGYRYAVYHQLGGALLIAGVVAHHAATGTFVFESGIAAGLPRLLAVLGVGLNVGFLGLHVWLPDAYPAPSVATSVVLCGFTTKVGVYALVRVAPGGSRAVAYLGGGMLLFGVTMAILQTELRRLLTYHIVSQVGYMVAGVGVASALAVDGALAHLVNNVLYKSLLFMVAGVLVVRTGEERLKQLGGLGRAMPVTAGAYLVAALAIAGTPGFAGFVSKGLVTKATEAAGFDLLWWVLVVGGVGTVVSFAKFGYYVFLREGSLSPADASRGQAAAMAILAVPCVAFGLVPGLGFALLPGGGGTFVPYTVSEVTKAVVTLGVGVVAFALVRRPLSTITPVPDLDALYTPAGAALRDATVRAVAAGAAALDRAGRLAVRWADAVVSDRRLAGDYPPVGRGVLLVALAAALLVAVLLV